MSERPVCLSKRKIDAAQCRDWFLNPQAEPDVRGGQVWHNCKSCIKVRQSVVPKNMEGKPE